MTCVLPRNCKKTLQSLPYETSSRPDGRLVVTGRITTTESSLYCNPTIFL